MTHESPAETIPQLVAPLRWSSEPPKVPGWYWYNSDGFGIGMVLVVIAESVPRARWTSVECVNFTNGQWAGPIPEPEEPQP
ncbi:MAG: hypothetical protein KGL39_08165 [Patescibacteria group bacterium]|nr:hypothetical protein [Patescibacteria group bacterium]